MEKPKGKKWFWSKTIWSGIGTVGIGIFMLLSGNIPEGILAITTGAGAIFGRSVATQEITTTPDKPITP